MAGMTIEIQPATEALPEHLIRLPGTERWALWRWSGLRAAGFPAAQVLTLAATECAALADQLVAATEHAEQRRNQALEAINTGLDLLRQNQEWDSIEKREPLLRALRALKKGNAPASHADMAAEQPIQAFQAARAEEAALQGRFDRAFETATAHTSKIIYELAREDRFREALIWQNRRALHSAVEPLLKKPPSAGARGSQQRQHEELVAMYLQRYCAKNDTIGFFGPVGWARFVDRGPALNIQPGPQLLSARNVYFEQWCIDGLAEALNKNTLLRPWLTPRRVPYIYLNGTTLYLQSHSLGRIPAVQALALRCCDGEQTAQEIAIALLRAHPGELRNENDAFKLLEDLQSKGLILWTLEIPFVARPEQALRQQLDRIADQRLYKPAIAALDELEAARQAVARAAGDAGQLDQALGALESTFTRLTGAAWTRGDGTMYAGRTLVYEDCRRDITAAIGPEALEPLGPPLSLLLESARWFTFEAATLYRKAFKRIYTILAQQSGSRAVDAISFWRQVQRLLNSKPRLIDSLEQVFRERWANVLRVAPGQRHVAYTYEALRPLVQQAFSSPHSGWRRAQYHSPDIMIAAPSVEAIRQGDYQFVLGEFHLTSNTLRAAFFVAEHPAPEELLQAVERDLAGQFVTPIVPKNWPEMTSRTRPAFILPRDYRLALTNDACGAPLSRMLPIGEVVIEDGELGLVGRTRDGRLSFDIFECFAELLSQDVVDSFKVLHPASHTPRVTIDRLVVCRETWRFAAADMAFAYEKSEAERFLAARHWMQAHDLPRYMFVTAPVERKPLYIDLDSPILVNILAKLVRRTAESDSAGAQIKMAEMLPTPDQIWLPDAAGQHYTSEFRIVVVDLESGQPAKSKECD